MDKNIKKYIKTIKDATDAYLEEEIELKEMDKLIKKARHIYITLYRREKQHV